MGEWALDSRMDRSDVVVQIAGDLDADSAPALHDALVAHRPDPGRLLLVNLAQVRSCDPCSVNALVTAKRTITATDGRFIVIAPGYPVARALRTTGLARAVSIAPTAQAARRMHRSTRVPQQRSVMATTHLVLGS